MSSSTPAIQGFTGFLRRTLATILLLPLCLVIGLRHGPRLVAEATQSLGFRLPLPLTLLGGLLVGALGGVVWLWSE